MHVRISKQIICKKYICANVKIHVHAIFYEVCIVYMHMDVRIYSITRSVAQQNLTSETAENLLSIVEVRIPSYARIHVCIYFIILALLILEYIQYN